MAEGVTICLPLFANPGQELEEGAPVSGRQVRDLAAALGERLAKAADTLDRLAAAGWSFRMAMYDVLLLHPDVATEAEATRRFQELGVDPGELMIIEDVDEDEEGDEVE
jgi:hypothetical protein